MEEGVEQEGTPDEQPGGKPGKMRAVWWSVIGALVVALGVGGFFVYRAVDPFAEGHTFSAGDSMSSGDIRIRPTYISRTTYFYDAFDEPHQSSGSAEYLKVEVEVTNIGSYPRRVFCSGDYIYDKPGAYIDLTSSSGAVYRPDIELGTSLKYGSCDGVGPGITEKRVLVFEVPRGLAPGEMWFRDRDVGGKLTGMSIAKLFEE